MLHSDHTGGRGVHTHHSSQDPSPKRIKIESSAVHNTNTLMEGDISVDLHESTIAALILGSVLMIATISLSSIKIIAWRRRIAADGLEHPGPVAPTSPPAAPSQPLACFPDFSIPTKTSTPGDSTTQTALEQAVARMIAQDREDRFYKALNPTPETAM
jgi:hypothetical protein